MNGSAEEVFFCLQNEAVVRVHFKDRKVFLRLELKRKRFERPAPAMADLEVI